MRETLNILLVLFGGLSIFIYGMQVLSDGLQLAAGDKMKKILAMLTSNPFVAVLSGALVTALLQSSSVTSVMVVGFVSAGLLTIPQAIAVIFGASIGTTMTAQIIAFDVGSLAYLFLFIGFIMSFFMKKKIVKYIGQALFGFGLLFVGLDLMSDMMKPLAQSPVFEDMILKLGQSPVLGTVVGTVMTAIVQSSSASVGVLQKLASQPIDAAGTALISLKASLPLLFGFNIGTTVTALAASIGSKADGKRVAVAHLIFKVTGTLLFLFLIPPFVNLIVSISPKGTEAAVISRQIANAHTVFNIITTVIWLPFINVLVKLVKRIIKDDPGQEENKVMYIDHQMLNNAPVAIELTVNELSRMAELTKKMMISSRYAVLDLDTEAIKRVFGLEETVDMLNQEIVKYISALLATGELTEQQSTKLAGLLHISNDIERIGDHCNNMAEAAETRISDNLPFSDNAYSDLNFAFDKINIMLDNTIACMHENGYENAIMVTVEEEEMDKLKATLRARHINRLNSGLCDPRSVILFIELVNGMERVGDHCNNIAELVIEETGKKKALAK